MLNINFISTQKTKIRKIQQRKILTVTLLSITSIICLLVYIGRLESDIHLSQQTIQQMVAQHAGND